MTDTHATPTTPPTDIDAIEGLMEEYPIDPYTTDISPEMMQVLTEQNKINGIVFSSGEQEEITSKIETYQDTIDILTERDNELNTLINSLDLGFNPVLNSDMYDNLVINLNNLSEEDIIYTPYVDSEGRTRYYRLTIKQFAEYVAATDNGYKFFSEDNEGNLVFDYESAKLSFNVNDNTGDERHRLQYEELSNQYIKYNDYYKELVNNEAIKTNLENDIKLAGYNYLETTDRYADYFENYNGNIDEDVKKALSTSNEDFNRIIINLDYLTDDQKKMIVYLSKGTEGSVFNYIEEAELQNQINNAIGLEMAQKYIDSLAKDANGNLTPNALNDIKTILTGLDNGSKGFLEGLNFALNGTEGEITETSYEQMYILQYLNSQNQLGNVLGVEYNISTSIGNMLIPIEASAIMSYLAIAGIPTIASETVGNIFFGASIYGNTYN